MKTCFREKSTLLALSATVVSSVAFSSPARPEPRNSAFDVKSAYTAEIWQTVAGGINRDSVYLDNLDVTLDVDLDALWGIERTRVFLYGLYNNGRQLSDVRTGDLQVISNIETGVEAARVYEAWIETRLGGGGSVRFGLYDLNSEFDVLAASGLFINSAHGIGTDFGQTGENGPSIFPVTSLALRVDWQLGDRWTLRAAALDGVPGDPEDSGATAIRLRGSDGALLVGELEWSTGDDRLLAGGWSYTADFAEWRPATAQTEKRSDRNRGIYLRGETELGSPPGGLNLFGRIGIADSDYNVFSAFFGAGLTWTGALTGRPHDEFGVAVAWAEASEAFQASQVTGTEERELAFEVTYRFPLTERIALQPDLQYVVNPGLDPALDDALAIGLRLELTLL